MREARVPLCVYIAALAAAIARAAHVNISGVTLSAARSRWRGAVRRDLEGSRNP